MPREFKEIADDLRSDGALRDFYICGTTRTHWNAVLRRVRCNWKAHRFSIDGETQELPSSFEAIEHLRGRANLCLGIQVADAYVNCHFFWDEEIEFDFRPEDFRTPSDGRRYAGFSKTLLIRPVNPASPRTRTGAGHCQVDRFEPIAKIKKGDRRDI